VTSRLRPDKAALFFAVVALMLVGGIVRLVTLDVFSMVFMGAVAGLALGMASARYAFSRSRR